MRKALRLLMVLGGLWPATAFAQQPVTIVGQKTPNVSAPTALRNLPVMPAIACAAAQSLTAGRVVFPCTNLFGYTGIFLTDPSTGAALTASVDATAGNAAKDTGPQVMGDCDDTATVAGTENAAARLRVDCTSRALYTRVLDPCSAVAKTHISISISTATTTELTPSLAGASTHYYICALDLVTAAANNVALTDDDSDGCGSVTSGLAGGTTAATGWNFVAGGGLVKGNGMGTVFKTGGTNRVVCLVTSAATQLSGSIEVVAAP